ncbi:MAG TPA: AMP-binding protein, partial [Gaiellaceae bacterium]|nr:AMP-binding protein [Gaiellaceae bacterium]
MSSTSYDQACADHRWEVPARYNIAADVCDKHERTKPAMIWESFDGSTREVEWGELQDLANQAAHTLTACGVGQGDRVAVVLPPTPEAAAMFFGVWKLGAILLSMSVLYGDDGIEHRLSDSDAKVLVTDPGNAPRFDRPWAPKTLVLEPDTLARASTDFVCADTAPDDPAQLYYTSGTTG